MVIEEVRNRFARLSDPLCQVAALAMAERLMAGYESFASQFGMQKDCETLKQAMSDAWKWISLNTVVADAVTLHMRKVKNVIPDVDDFDDGVASFGLDSASAVYLALQSLLTAPLKCLGDISILSTDSADRYVQQVLNIHEFNTKTEKEILLHPLMQSEIEAQAFLLDIVEKSNDVTEAVKNSFSFAVRNRGATALTNSVV